MTGSWILGVLVRLGILLGLGAFSLPPALALPEAIGITDDFEHRQLARLEIEYVEDQAGKLELDNVIHLDRWQSVQTSAPNFGFTRSSYWFRIAVRNDSTQKFQGIVELQYPILDWVQFYVLKNDKVVKKTVSGDMLNFSEREVSYHNPAVVLPLESGETAFIYVRVQTESSMQVPIKVWEERTFWSDGQLPFAIQAVYLGVMVGMIFYNFFIFLSHRSTSYLLYVGFVSSYTLFQISLQGLGMEFLWPESPNWNRISLPLGTSLSLFFSSLFTPHFLKIRDVSRVLYVLLFGSAIFLGFLSLSAFFVHSSTVVQLSVGFSIPLTIICIASGIVSWHKGNPLGFYFMLAWSSLLLGTMLTALNKLGVIERNLFTEYAQQIGSYLEVKLLSFALAYRLNLISKEKLDAQRQTLEAQEALNKAQKEANDQLLAKNQEIQDINHNLEKIVAFRTRELKTIFDNIPQGVASLNEEGIISQNYSRHLELLWNQKDLAGRSIFEFLGSTTLSADSIDRMRQSLKACVGEDHLNFQVNSGNFPSEADLLVGQESFHYALTWSPEVTAEGRVHSVLLTIEDISDKKLLEQESERQRKDMQIIQELLSCENSKVEVFASSSRALLDENARLTQAGALAVDDIKIMFVNAHTVKGGARTLNFSLLANVLHDLEHEYASILQGEKAPNQDLLWNQLQEATRIFQVYMTTNSDTLGRKTNANGIFLDLDFIREHYKTLDTLTLKASMTPAELLEDIRRARDTLARIIFKSDTLILEQCLESAEKIAKDLGKPAPKVVLQSGDIQLSRSTEHLLRNIFIHILRNALDHGVEPAQERLAKGKGEAGNIHVRSRMEGEIMVLEFEDDGRGLAIEKLRNQGVKRGLIGQDADIESVAETIFVPGLSTAASISQVSGRGVGMDAVRRFIEDAGGTVRLQLKDGKGAFIPFIIRIELPIEAGPHSRRMAS